MSIKAKLLIFALSISLIPISVITTLYYFNSRNTIKKQTLDWLTAVAESKKVHILSFLDAKKSQVIDFSSDGYIRNNLKIIMKRGSQSHVVNRLNKHLAVNKKTLDTNIEAIAILDINGKVVASTNKNWIGKDMSGEEIFTNCVSKNYGKAHINKAHYIPYLNANCIFIAAPLTGRQSKETIGAIINAYDMATLDEITTKRSGMGKSGEIFLIMRDHDDIVLLTSLKYASDTPLGRSIPMDSFDTELIRLALNEKRGAVIAPDYRGTDVVAAYLHLPDMDWGLVTKIDKEEVFASIARIKIFTIILGSISALLAITISIIISKRVAKPIHKLVEGTRRIAKGDLAFRIETLTRDEIGQLVTAFNDMTFQLEQSKKKLNDYMDNLEEKVEDKTKEITQMLYELTDKNKEMEQFLYVASHDLRSPLLNIQGFSKELQKSFDTLRPVLDESGIPSKTKEKLAEILEEDIPDALRFILTSSSKMDKLLSGLLRLSRMGNVPLTIRQLDMNKLISNVIETYKYTIKEAKVTFQLEELPPCRGDESQINQVFSNLIDNALKYLDSGKEGVIRISGRKEDGSIVYCLEDNGIGIAKQHQDNIFEIFHRLNPGDNIGGEGLGLTIVHRILNRHNGKIWVESEPGKGSKFFVSLPT
ncbi:MAG: sensor histidine kinase [Candidatus Kuenenia sp.]|nr:sensor histidine kinase [Candidatus Kuenenia hertensis]